MTQSKKKELLQCAQLALECEKTIAELRLKVNSLHDEIKRAELKDEQREEVDHFYDGADERLMHAEDYCNQANDFLKTAAELKI